MEIRFADRMENIPPYAFATIAQKVSKIEASGNKVIRLDMGSPDLPPASVVVDALHNSARKDSTHGYGGFTGTPDLRRAFSDYYRRRFEVDLDPGTQVLPLIGSKEGIVNIAFALVNPGQVVLVPELAYPAYAAGAYLAGGEPVDFKLDAHNGYLPDLSSISPEVARRAAIMWINYPHNPTGSVATVEDLKKVVDFCREHEIVLCSDNPYADIAFDGTRPPSILEVEGASDLAVEFNSLSKTYNMAGWRIGVCVGNADLVGALLRVKSNIDSGLFRSIQDASCVALDQVSADWVAERNFVYEQRRNIVIDGLSTAGLSASTPKAGIYVWARVEAGDDQEYADMALERAHVSLTPGRIYGKAGIGFVRISLVTDNTYIAEAMTRLGQWQASK